MCCICCGSILSLVQILLSFVSNSLSYITTPKTKTKKIELRIKLNHNIHKTTLKGKKGGKATQANLTDDWAPKELLAELKRKFPSCHEHPHHLRLSTEAFAPVKRCSPLCYMYWHHLLVELDDFLDFFFCETLSRLWPRPLVVRSPRI